MLGEAEETYTLNFSRGSAMLIAQYYNFLRLGVPGYTRIMKGVLEVAQRLAGKLVGLNRFIMLNDGQRLPIVAFRHARPARYTLMALSHKLREQGWIVPAYQLPEDARDIEVMRVVVRENFGADLADRLASDIESACRQLEGNCGFAASRAEAVSEVAYPVC
jgi:glutamate decarboxylase